MFLNGHHLKFCGHDSYNPSNSCWNSHCYIIMCLSVVCSSRIGCRSVWLKGTPNGSGLLPSPQTVYATAKIINTEFIKLYSHRITYQLIWKLSLTPVSFISLSSRRCHGDDVRNDGNEAPVPPWPVCLHPLLNDVVPYWRQVIPSIVSVEARVQGSYIDSFLHSSFKPSGFSCQDFIVLQSTECSGCSMWICFETSEVVELGLRCSLNLDFRDLSVSPTYVASHFSHLILV